MENAQQEILCPTGGFQLWTECCSHKLSFFKESQCCYGACGPAPHRVTLTALLLPTHLVGWQKGEVYLGVPSCADPIKQSPSLELSAAPAAKWDVKPRVCTVLETLFKQGHPAEGH